MRVGVPEIVFGNGFNLLVDDDKFSWVQCLPPDTLLLGAGSNHPYNIHEFLKLFNKATTGLITPTLSNIASELGVNIHDVPFSRFYRKDDFKLLLHDAIEHCRSSLSELTHPEYIDIFLKCQEVLKGMSGSHIDLSELNKFEKENKGRLNKKLLDSFRSTRSGKLPPALYSNTNTITGRMTVLSGPQLLTAPKEIRAFLKSRNPGGRLIQADYISLEPRVARLIHHGSAPEDIYVAAGNDLFSGELSRDQVKMAFLCAIYGAGERKLRSILPERFKPRSIVKDLREYIGFSDIVSKNKKELRNSGVMFNHFGRPMTPSGDRETVIFNNWLQSSAADAALLGFNKLIRSVDATPVFLIHDALIFDVPADKISDFKTTLGKGIVIPSLGIFPLEYLDISA
jgi:hypothetical protein